mmetsp:Transcript_56082/g.105660  ORF Transcript_56082/g.105660 Transcript_56082/m.105660 type:complete len:330 (-) Transcript_56082:75-1064(-)
MVNYGAAPALHAPVGHQDLGHHSLMGGTIVKMPDHAKSRKRMNIMGICLSLFLPWTMFCVIAYALSFSLHYDNPVAPWFFVGFGAVLALAFLGMAAAQMSRKPVPGDIYAGTWNVFLFLTLTIAVIAGTSLGNSNYETNMQQYYDLLNLNDYIDVDPSRMRGQQMMDAGRVKFVKNTKINLGKAYAFQNLDTYCVAPITIFSEDVGAMLPLASYDFWAVGTNCCGSNQTTDEVDFQCGDYNSKYARQGLRLMKDDQRAFFRLAVQQASSAHQLVAQHPLFFYWASDALDLLESIRVKGFQTYAIGMIGHFVFQLFLVLIAMYVFAQWGF